MCLPLSPDLDFVDSVFKKSEEVSEEPEKRTLERQLPVAATGGPVLRPRLVLDDLGKVSA